ncbi:MAG: HEPN domain-containing protein [Chloroflexi bacterium]|nr:HEPN domain-containing protein [Chloroflexota bacterium]MBI3761224.1 HEPN domain-containing protein [Chloroflexota bacterium]
MASAIPMPLLNTYHRRIQVGASRRRLEDARACLEKGRWIAAIYLGGYAVECALKAYICLQEGKDDFRETQVYQQGAVVGRAGHNLQTLYNAAGAPVLRSMFNPHGEFHRARQLVVKTWYPQDNLRYSHRSGKRAEAEAFVRAVEMLHGFLLELQGER